jgi:hypothetical protein
MTVSSSPERHTFQKEGYVKRCEEQGKLPNPDYVDMYKTWRDEEAEQIKDPEWQKNNLEYDLRSTDWILDKARKEVKYAQNVYAALCNNDWMNVKGTDPAVTMDLLKEKFWSCSWRHAGGIVADMLGKGDYVDWYCSGIGGLNGEYDTATDPNFDNMSEEQQGQYFKIKDYVPEGVVTIEVREDLKKLGWIVIEDKKEER